MNTATNGLKTWSTLAGGRRRPTEYEVVSYNLHTRTRHPGYAYELSPELFMNRFYREHVGGSVLQHPDWDAFRDPDEMIYRQYNALQDGHEEYVDGLLEEHARNRHDLSLDPGWVQRLPVLYTAARYPLHALQMAAAYVVQMAPASTISNCAAFQGADQYRWISRLAYRTRELQLAYPTLDFGAERAVWEGDVAWQGFRELFEKVLATYDWGEHVIALNVVAKPAFDICRSRQFARAARDAGDTLTAMLLEAEWRDCERSQRWTKALVSLAAQHAPNQVAMAGIVARWQPLANAAIDAWCAALPALPDAAAAARNSLLALQQSCGVQPA